MPATQLDGTCTVRVGAVKTAARVGIEVATQVDGYAFRDQRPLALMVVQDTTRGQVQIGQGASAVQEELRRNIA